jgi:RHS repeat-associated protein
VLVTDESGQQVWSAEYTPFGKQVSKEGELDRAAKFAGKDLDEDTRLYYFNARWYDQETGRFISEDPKFDPNNPNLYWYCDNNPLTNVDLDGRETTRADQKVFDKWFSVWTTINNNAVNSERTQRQAIWKQDPVGYAENRSLYNMGRRDIFGKEYQNTVNLIDTSTAMMSAAPKVQDWIENQISNGHTPTLEEINNKAAQIAKANEDFETYMAPIIYGAIGWAQMGAGKSSQGNNAKLTEEGAGNTFKSPELKIDDIQFGNKVGKHAEDYGLSPKSPQSRQWVRDHIENIHNSPDEVRQGTWRGLGEKLPDGNRAEGNAIFYRQGNDVVVTDMNGNFVTILKDGVVNSRFQGATAISTE